MDYSKICEVYAVLEKTTKGLEKTDVLAGFLEEIKKNPELIYLLQGRVFSDWDNRELGLSHQLVIKAISRAVGIESDKIVDKFRDVGDLGKVVEGVLKKGKRQRALFEGKLSVEKVMDNLRKVSGFEGKGAVDFKIGMIVELLHSASPEEAKYIIRTVLGDLKIGVGSGLLRDAIVVYCFEPKDLEEKKKYSKIIQDAYNKVMDFAEIFERACNNSLNKIKLKPGRPVKVMLFPKAKDIEDAFRIVGRPAAFEYKYDGFRVMVNKEKNGRVRIFTRRLEEVTEQFPDIVEYIDKNVKGKNFILDCEVVGYDGETGRYTDFQAISQRIKRKYDIDKLRKKLPIELVVFDIIYYDSRDLINAPFKERRKLIEKIVKEKEWKIVLAKQIVTSEVGKVEDFYNEALADNQEGVMGKKLDAPYKPGARIGYAVKLKPEDKDFDLVITGAEWGTGKRAGWLTSFDVACQNLGDEGRGLRVKGGELLEVGKVSTGLKELEEQGLSYNEITNMLKKLTIKTEGRKIKVKPEIVVTVQYQNIQKSPSYSSGYALRFPRILRLREDRGVSDIVSLGEIEGVAKN